LSDIGSENQYLVLCLDKKLNYNGRYFFEDQGEKPASPTVGRAGADVAVATASIFNADIRIKNNISLSSLFRQSTWLEGNFNIYS